MGPDWVCFDWSRPNRFAAVPMRSDLPPNKSLHLTAIPLLEPVNLIRTDR